MKYNLNTKHDFTGQNCNDCGYRAPSNKYLKKHVEDDHKKEKLLNAFVVPNVIIFCTDFI